MKKVRAPGKDDVRPLQMAIVDGQGWIQYPNGAIEDYTDEVQPIERYWNGMLASLPRYLKMKAKFAQLPEQDVDGTKAIGLGIEADGEKSAFYLDSMTGLVVKSEKMTRLPVGQSEAPAFTTTIYRSYRKIGGIQAPMKLTMFPVDGKRFAEGGKIELEIEAIQFLESIDPGKFARPSNLSTIFWVFTVIAIIVVVLLAVMFLKRRLKGNATTI